MMLLILLNFSNCAKLIWIISKINILVINAGIKHELDVLLLRHGSIKTANWYFMEGQ